MPWLDAWSVSASSRTLNASSIMSSVSPSPNSLSADFRLWLLSVSLPTQSIMLVSWSVNATLLSANRWSTSLHSWSACHLNNTSKTLQAQCSRLEPSDAWRKRELQATKNEKFWFETGARPMLPYQALPNST